MRWRPLAAAVSPATTAGHVTVFEHGTTAATGYDRQKPIDVWTATGVGLRARSMG